MPLEVIGAGFGRTGTNSLRLALEELGFGPCHHMYEVATHPEQVPVWQAIARGGSADWEAVFAGYRSQVDWPGARYWSEMADAFPAAKVILTVRPAEDWFRSFSATIGPEVLAPPKTPGPLGLARRLMQREIIARQVFGDRPLDRAHAVAVFRDHIGQVQRRIAPERLLVFDVATGWGPLCALLGVGNPAHPFPRTNSVREFQDDTWIKGHGD